MIIKIDNREQRPLVFDSKLIESVQKCTLNVGDYGCCLSDGYEVPVYFERKSISDLYGTLSQGYDRFKKELLRAKEQNKKLILIIESSLTRVLQGVGFSQRTPESITYQIFTISLKYDLEIVFTTSREESSIYITNYYYAYSKEYNIKKMETYGNCKSTPNEKNFNEQELKQTDGKRCA